MAAVGGNNINIVRFNYTGAEGEDIPDGATHITIDESCSFVRSYAFRWHDNIVEVICHDRVEKIEKEAFRCCLKLRRVIMPGVKALERDAFDSCRALTDVECGKLEIIDIYAFESCTSLYCINLPSARIVEEGVFWECTELTDVKFGIKLERFGYRAFFRCYSLERITIPLKDGLITPNSTFQACENLKHINLVEEEILHETIAALQLEEWRNDMGEEIDSINQILPTTYAGYYENFGGEEDGQKARAIRRWIGSVLHKIILYQAEHQLLLNEAASTIHHVLPQDIVMNNVLSLLALPSHLFGGDGQEDAGRT